MHKTNGCNPHIIYECIHIYVYKYISPNAEASLTPQGLATVQYDHVECEAALARAQHDSPAP